MELRAVGQEHAINSKNKSNLQKRAFHSRYLFIIFLVLMILGSGYNTKISDLQKRETKATLLSTSKSIERKLAKLTNDGIQDFNKANLFYKKSGNQPLWTEGFQQNHYAKSLELILAASVKYGLKRDEELVKSLEDLKEKMLSINKALNELSRSRAEYEIKLTNAALKMLVQLEHGIFYADTLKNDSIINRYSNYLLGSIQSENFEEMFLSVQPENKIYIQLINGLNLFLERTSWSKERYKIDSKDSASVKNIAASVFYELGYINSKTGLDSAEFISALKTFQKYHGIKQSGELCKKTVSALELSSYERYQQILLNIERARSEKFLENTYVYINIPAYSLKFYQDGILELQHKVVVGKPESQTPVLSSKLEYIVANPKWYVPKSISRGEILYKLRKDSTYLETRNFVLLDKDYQALSQSEINWKEVSYSNFDYKIYQEPGSRNALGTIKFMFPNKYSVYVHDTPSKRLFKNDYRAYSHGCVRLENPLDFADHLLTYVDTDNLYKTVKPMVKSKKTKEIRFSEPIDIHIRYYTCEVDENNLTYFYQDVYEKDEILKEQLFMN